MGVIWALIKARWAPSVKIS